MNIGFGLSLTARLMGTGAGGAGGSISISRGFLPTRDEGTAGNYYVDASVASSGAGTSIGTAFKTISEAITASVGGNTIRVRNNAGTGTYRETVAILSGKDGLKVLGYGTEKPIITGAEPLTSWTACVVGDATDVGSNWTSMYKKTVAATSFVGSNARAAFLFENSTELYNATAWLENPQYPNATERNEQWLTADDTVYASVSNSFVANASSTITFAIFDTWSVFASAADRTAGTPTLGTGTTATTYAFTYAGGVTYYVRGVSGGLPHDVNVTPAASGTYEITALIAGYKNAAVTGAYTSAQILNADAVFHYFPNVNGRTPVLSVVGGTINLTDQTRTYENNPNKDKFALVNILPAMKRGQWGWKDAGVGNITLYVWPNSAGSMTAGITYTARGRCIQLGSSSDSGSSGVELRGLIVERCTSGGASTDQNYAIASMNLAKKAGITIDNVLARNTFRANRDYAAVTLRNIDNAVVRNVEVQNAVGQGGIMLFGGSYANPAAADPALGALVTLCRVNSEITPYRFYGQWNMAVALNDTTGAGLAAHANLSMGYEGCHNCLWYGNMLVGGEGYLTWQEASRIAVVGNVIMAGEDGRGVNDQNHGSSTVTRSPADVLAINGAGYVFNNTLLPNPNSPTDVRSLTLGYAGDPAATYVAHNNVLNGVVVDAGPIPTYVTAFSHNLLTTGTTPAGGTNGVVSSISAEYVDAAAGNFAYKAGAAVRSAAAKSMATEIAVLQGRFPQFTGWGYDVNGNAINWAAPPMGAVVGYDAGFTQPAVWYTRPVISGAPLVGVALAVDNGFAKMAPYAAPTFQWNRTNDGGNTYADLAGSTASTYTPISGDVGYRIGVKITASGATVQATPTLAVASSYPISNPVLKAFAVLPTSAGSSATIETGSFTVSSKQIFVVVTQRNTSAADTTLTATIGTALRTAGTGTAITFAARRRTSSTEMQHLLLLTPQTGTFTVQVDSSLAKFGCVVSVYEISGVTGLGSVTGTNNSTVTSHTTSGTTTAANSLVFQSISKLNGGDAMSLSGATLLDERGSGVSTSSDVRAIVGYELASSVGAYAATASWTTAATAIGLVTELLS